MRKLKTISREYNINFRKIMRCKKGSKEHYALLKRENELYKEQVAAMKAAGTFVNDPCPIGKAWPCHDCTGLYSITGKMSARRVHMHAIKGEGVQECIYKEFLGNARRKE